MRSRSSPAGAPLAARSSGFDDPDSNRDGSAEQLRSPSAPSDRLLIQVATWQIGESAQVNVKGLRRVVGRQPRRRRTVRRELSNSGGRYLRRVVSPKDKSMP